MRGFEGRWTILREIADRKNGTIGRLAGQAVFRKIPERKGALFYEERGELVLEGAGPMTAERRYVWAESDGGLIEVEFEDGRRFHTIDLNRTMPFADHFCTPDHYWVNYDFRDWPVWHCEWHVRGPRKDYRMRSRYRYMGDVSRVLEACAQSAREADSGQVREREGGDRWQSTQPTGF